jgi:hypothetical protein
MSNPSPQPKSSSSLSLSNPAPSPSLQPRASPSLVPSPQNLGKTRTKRKRRKESFYQVQQQPAGGGAIPLENAWTIWVDGGSSVGLQQQEYQQRIIPIGSFDNIQVLFHEWTTFSRLFLTSRERISGDIGIIWKLTNFA